MRGYKLFLISIILVVATLVVATFAGLGGTPYTMFLAISIMISFGISLAGIIIGIKEERMIKRKVGIIGNFLVILFFVFIVIYSFQTSSRYHLQGDKKYPSTWNGDDWTPIIMRESDSINYYGAGVDTLYQGDLFKAKLYFPIREFYDSIGHNKILNEHQMKFEIGPDTFPKYSSPKLTKMNKYLTVVKDTGYLEIPIDSIILKYPWDSILWRASIQPTADTVYAIEGAWVVKSNR